MPLGTTVRDDGGVMLADLVETGQSVVVATGGRGGRGNAAFVSSARKAPNFAEQGEYGDEAWVELELKVLADAALVGYPNAGKSTLISRVSAAQPKIADYPFTTLEPNLGVVDLSDREFVLADVPGLIEGAAAGKGLGHEFLRHVERARVLVLLLDPTELQEESLERQHDVLVTELSEHHEDLGSRPRFVVVNKSDVAPDADLSWAESRDVDVHVVSAVTGDGLDELMYAIADEVAQHEREAPHRPGFLLHRPLPDAFSVAKHNDEWVVTGKAAERAINLADLTVPEAADFAASRLDRLGVDDALLAAGARPGDDVRIGDLVFTFDSDAIEEVEE